MEVGIRAYFLSALLSNLVEINSRGMVRDNDPTARL